MKKLNKERGLLTALLATMEELENKQMKSNLSESDQEIDYRIEHPQSVSKENRSIINHRVQQTLGDGSIRFLHNVSKNEKRNC